MAHVTSNGYDIRLVHGRQQLNGEPCDAILDQDDCVLTITDGSKLEIARRALAAGVALGESAVNGQREPSNVVVVKVPLVPIQPAFSALPSVPDSPALRSLQQMIQGRG